jgi:putative transposase
MASVVWFMARPERLVIPGVAMHVRHRGVNRQDCFREDIDRVVYLSCLKELAATTGCAIHAYCLMTNHVHFLLTPGDPGACATLMRELGQRYVPYFNRRHGRTGTLWEGRFRSCLVDSPLYVLGCYRYIERNPVEASMVARPESYRWSSYNGNSGLMDDQLLTPHVEYTALGTTLEARRSSYRGLFDLPEQAEVVKALRRATMGGYALVGDQLKARLVADGERVEPAKPGPRTKPVDEAAPASLDLFG